MNLMDKQINISITAGTIVKAILVILAFVLVYLLRDIVLVLLTAVVIASAIEPAAGWFVKRRLPRLLAVILVYAVVVLIVAAAVIFFVPPIVDEISALSGKLPEFIGSFSLPDFLSFDSGPGLAIPPEIIDVFSLESLIGRVGGALAGLSQNFFKTLSLIFGGAFSFVMIVVISFYLAAKEKGIENFLRVVTPYEHEKYVIDLWKRSQTKIGNWFKGQLMLGVVIAVLVFLGLTILGVKYAMLLAILAGLIELIPYFGPVVAAIPAVLLGFNDSVTLGFMVLGFYIIIQQFENHLIYPLVVTKIVGVPPLLVILSLIIGGKLAGFLGILLAVPMAAVLMELYYDLDARKARLEHQTEVKSE